MHAPATNKSDINMIEKKKKNVQNLGLADQQKQGNKVGMIE